MAKPVTQEKLDEFVQATAQTMAVLAGLIADATGHVQTAAHLAAAVESYGKVRPNKIRDELLVTALRMTLIKARNTAPTDPVVQALAATWLGDQQKH